MENKGQYNNTKECARELQYMRKATWIQRPYRTCMKRRVGWGLFGSDSIALEEREAGTQITIETQ